jgi:hypothetical protein
VVEAIVLDIPFFAGAKNGISVRQESPEQKHDENDEQNKAETAAAVVTESWSHAVSTEAEHKDQNDQKNKHCSFSVRRRFATWRCDADFVKNVKILFCGQGCLIA